MERYVYILFHPATGLPFYVGKGLGNRWNDHERNPVRGRSHKDNLILWAHERGLEIPKVKIAVGLTNDEACAIERAFIAAIGRQPNGPLTNQTDGGEGLVNPSADARERIAQGQRGKKWPQERKDRRNAKLIGQKRTLESCAKLSASLRAAGTSPKALSARRRNGRRVRSPEERERAAKLQTGKPSPWKGATQTESARWAMSRTKKQKRWGQANDFVLGALAVGG